MAHEQDCKIHSPQRFDDYHSIPTTSSLRDLSTEDLIQELRRRRKEHKRLLNNAKIVDEIKVLEKAIEKLKAKIE